MAFKRVVSLAEAPALEALQDMADKLNYAEEHMPNPKKTVEQFLELCGHDLQVEVEHAIGTAGVDYIDNETDCFRYLRPEIRKHGYSLKMEDMSDGTRHFQLGRWFRYVSFTVNPYHIKNPPKKFIEVFDFFGVFGK